MHTEKSHQKRGLAGKEREKRGIEGCRERERERERENESVQSFKYKYISLELPDTHTQKTTD